MREAVSTSPGAFLTTVAEIDARSSDHWEDELRSSTWAVVQRGDEVFGIAAAKLPSDDDGYIRHSQTARFIESVWIAPSMRGNGYGERLIKYLFDAECKKSADVDRFFVWVLSRTQQPSVCTSAWDSSTLKTESSRAKGQTVPV